MENILKIINISEIPPNSLTLVNNEIVDRDSLFKALSALPKKEQSENRKILFVQGDASKALAILTEAELNEAGWYRK